LFKNLNKEELELLNKERAEVKFKAGEIIIKQGMPANHMISVTSGLVKIYIEGVQGKSLILELLGPWNFFGGPGIYLDHRHHYSAAAIEDTTTCFIDANRIKELIRKNPDFAENFIKGCSKKSSDTFERFVSLTQKHMHGRIADALLYLSREIYKKEEFDLTLSKQDIADLTAMTKDSAVRILKELHNDAIIQMNNGTIILPEYEKLEELSLMG
jgi:CRP/FNR family transcriptional regulator